MTKTINTSIRTFADLGAACGASDAGAQASAKDLVAKYHKAESDAQKVMRHDFRANYIRAFMERSGRPVSFERAVELMEQGRRAQKPGSVEFRACNSAGARWSQLTKTERANHTERKTVRVSTQCQAAVDTLLGQFDAAMIREALKRAASK